MMKFCHIPKFSLTIQALALCFFTAANKYPAAVNQGDRCPICTEGQNSYFTNYSSSYNEALVHVKGQKALP